MSGFRFSNFINLSGTSRNGQNKPINNTYKPGSSGVGATSSSNRRAKNRSATVVGNNPGNQFMVFNKLGQYNKYTKSTNEVLTPIEPSAPILNETKRDLTNGNLELFFTPGFDGGSTITNIEYSSDNGYNWNNSTTLSSPIVITGLSTSIRYQVIIRSKNKNGFSDKSNIILSPMVPSAPTLNEPIRNINNDLELKFGLGSDGGSSITGIQYSINGGTANSWIDVNQIISPIIVPGLLLSDDITNYIVVIRAKNSVGNSRNSNQFQNPNPPILNSLTRNDVNNVLVVNFKVPDGILRITNIQYSLDGGNSWIDSNQITSPIYISDLENTYSHSVIIRSKNVIGPSIKSNELISAMLPNVPNIISLTRLINNINLSFDVDSQIISPVTSVEYSIDNGSNWVIINEFVIEPPVNISITIPLPLPIQNSNGALEDDNTNNEVIIKVKNSEGYSGRTMALRKPTIPTLLTAIRNTINNDLELYFELSEEDNSSVTDIEYSYSTNDGSTWTSWINANTTSSPITITNLPIIDGTTEKSYSFAIRSKNAIGYSSNSIKLQKPNPPIFNSIIPQNDKKLYLQFEPSFNGGSTITDIQYSLDRGNNWFTTGSTLSSIEITVPDNTIRYPVVLRAINALGYSTTSSAIEAPVLPSRPTLSTIRRTRENIDLEVVFELGSDGGSTITGIEYSLDNGSNWATTIIPPISPFTFTIANVPDDGDIRRVVLRSINAVGNSEKSNSFENPSAPTLTSSTRDSTINTNLIVNFTPGSNGGSAITDIQYSTDGSNWYSSGRTSSPITITGVSTSISYPVSIRAINVIGFGLYSNSLQTLTAPTLTSSSRDPVTNTKLILNFTPGLDGGSAVTDIEYSTDNGTIWTSSGKTSSPITITGVSTSISFTYVIRAKISSGFGPYSNSLQTLSAPTLTSSSRNSNDDLILNFTPGLDGGSAITSIEYSTDNGTIWTSSGQTSSPITITGVSSSSSPSCLIRTNNAIGTSPKSNTLKTLSAPTLTSSSRDSVTNTNLILNFTIGTGSPFTDFEYSTDNGTIWTSSGKTSSPITITGVSTSISFTYVIRAKNTIGTSSKSNSLQTLTAPTLSPISPGNTKLYVPFTLGTYSGPAITDIEYSTNGGTSWTSSGQTSTSITIISLTNGTSYNVIIRAKNNTGISPISNILSGTPNVTNISGITYVLATYTTTTTTITETTWTAPTGVTSVEYLVVGGGGGSGACASSGASGGGGGGMVLFGVVGVSANTKYDITVGSGGVAGAYNIDNNTKVNGNPGNDSKFNTITAKGGGGGYDSRDKKNGTSFGAGGAAASSLVASTGGNGNGLDLNLGSGGGGGAGSNGGTSSGAAGTAGTSTSNSITGTSLLYGAGGAGGKPPSASTSGGSNQHGAANTGNGAGSSQAGSAATRNGATGGSGIVILRYVF